MAWQHHIADVIMDAQKDRPAKQLISQNIANKTAKIVNPHPAVSIFNFHYAAPPEAVAQNYHLNRVIGDNETGFRGTNDAPYRTEAWDFLLAGGGLFNHLDYSFVAGHEDGTFVYPKGQPGGGNPGFRRQMRILRDFLHTFDFVRMRPGNSVIQGGVPKGWTARALVEPGVAYAIYLRGEGQPSAPELDLPAREYQAEWVDPLSGQVVKSEAFRHPGGVRKLEAPEGAGELALRLKRR